MLEFERLGKGVTKEQMRELMSIKLSEWYRGKRYGNLIATKVDYVNRTFTLEEK